ncbi:MAG: D-Ala-D-Ala carboxypeptidase family metallohydrolase [Gammaproteobacteria bacterium]|nr:D-Ala-D-Ala carboxypeptidase family metallohydrolase [Gammaproteobacteria bacterium]
MTYDDNGQLKTLRTSTGATDFQHGNFGVTAMSGATNARFQYDSQGRVIAAEDDEYKRTYKYDKIGSLVEVKENNTTTKFQLNSEGFISKVYKNDHELIAYDYDEVGRIRTIQYSDGRDANFNYGDHDLRTDAHYSDGVKAFINYDATGNMVHRRLKRKDGKEYTQRYIIGENNELLQIQHQGTTDIPNVDFTYDQAGNVISVSWGKRHGKINYDDLQRVVDVRVDDRIVLEETYEPMNYDNVLTRDTISANVVIHSSSSPVFGSLESIVYTRPNTSDFGIVNYSSELRGYVINANFLRPDNVLMSSLNRRFIPLGDEDISSQAFNHDKPSNSAFIPPEFNSVNCVVCSVGIIAGSISIVGDASVGNPVNILVRILGWCGEFSTEGSPILPWQHKISFGDGSGITESSEALLYEVSHTYQESGTYTIVDEILCSCSSLFADAVLVKAFHVLGPCPMQIQAIIDEYTLKKRKLVPECQHFIHEIFASSPNFSGILEYNSGTHRYLINVQMHIMAEKLRAEYNDYYEDDSDLPLWITSGYRNPVHNDSVGGVSGSWHQYGRAIDIQPMRTNLPEDTTFAQALKKLKDIATSEFDDSLYDLDKRHANYLHIEFHPDYEK